MNMNENQSFLKDKACEQYLKQDSSNGKSNFDFPPRHAIMIKK